MQGLVGQKFDVGRTIVGNAVDDFSGVQATGRSVRDVLSTADCGVLGNYMNPYTD